MVTNTSTTSFTGCPTTTRPAAVAYSPRSKYQRPCWLRVKNQPSTSSKSQARNPKDGTSAKRKLQAPNPKFETSEISENQAPNWGVKFETRSTKSEAGS